MKPKDLTIKQLKAIPLKEYDGTGYHKKTNLSLCDDSSIPECEDCDDITCVECCLDSGIEVEARIKELENK